MRIIILCHIVSWCEKPGFLFFHFGFAKRVSPLLGFGTQAEGTYFLVAMQTVSVHRFALGFPPLDFVTQLGVATPLTDAPVPVCLHDAMPDWLAIEINL